MNQQSLEQISQSISELLSQIEAADVEGRDDLLPRLNEQIEARRVCLAELLNTELAQNREWLKVQLDISRGLAQQGKSQLEKQRGQLGGYKKGRKQVSVYQNIELGK
ncbi:hypothetical protein SAMN04488540_11842 [Ferrimonas sediminum]|uniref:Flagellar protein FliT n=1 Tax=Ferrimonas sediminum TaxID=718193 RepID=A0A1G8YV26_9GAMM|nr:hypothetical protein [Ferrimonas sediminum]SDK06284.1 hypothetical protein SAMN04488540_11842 [Ferrimonas sediminum]